MMKMIKAIMYYAPIGLCAYFANLIGEFGPALLGSYAKTTILYIIMSVIYFLVAYTIYVYIARGSSGVRSFYKYILPSLVTSLATQSSLATLPTNLDTARDADAGGPVFGAFIGKAHQDITITHSGQGV